MARLTVDKIDAVVQKVRQQYPVHDGRTDEAEQRGEHARPLPPPAQVVLADVGEVQLQRARDTCTTKAGRNVRWSIDVNNIYSQY